MLQNIYKKALDRLPEGVFVFDDKLRVKFTNAAFRRSCSDGAKNIGALSAVLGCKEGKKCGENAACEYCAFTVPCVRRLLKMRKKRKRYTPT